MESDQTNILQSGRQNGEKHDRQKVRVCQEASDRHSTLYSGMCDMDDDHKTSGSIIAFFGGIRNILCHIKWYPKLVP